MINENVNRVKSANKSKLTTLLQYKRKSWKWIKKHPVKTGLICFSPFFAFLIIPFFVQWVTVTESPFDNVNVANNDWIGFWGGYIGAIISMIPIILTIRFESNRWKKQNLIERQPFIFADKHSVGTNSPMRPTASANDGEFEYEITDNLENGVESQEIGIAIENISSNHALNLRIAPAKNDSIFLYSLDIKDVSKFSPCDKLVYYIRLKYNKEELIKRHGSQNTLIVEKFIFKICYNTPFDELLDNNITMSNYNENLGRANKFNIYVWVQFDIDYKDISIINYWVSTTNKIIMD